MTSKQLQLDIQEYALVTPGERHGFGSWSHECECIKYRVTGGLRMEL